jgi:hypothetical protein
VVRPRFPGLGRRRSRASCPFKVLAALVDTPEVHGRPTATQNPGPAKGGGPGEGSADALSAQIRRDTRDWRVARPTLVLFMLVIGAGALFGALAFVLAGDHQARSAMIKTAVIETSSGWRVSSPEGLAQNVAGAMAVSTRIDALDLLSGRRRVVALGPKVSDLAISDGRILWTDRSRMGRGPLFVQDADGGPVVPLNIPGAGFSTLPVTSGDTLAWTQNQGAGQPSEVVIVRMDK